MRTQRIVIWTTLFLLFIGSLIFNLTVPINYVELTNQSPISPQSVTPTPTTTTPVSAEYYDTSNYCSGNPDQNIYINAPGTTEISSTPNSSTEQCENLCTNSADCEMYLIDPNTNTCNLYKGVTHVYMYCESGNEHDYYGNVKIKNGSNSDNVVDESLIVPPPKPTSTPTSKPASTPNQEEQAEQQANEQVEQANEEMVKEMEEIP